MRLRFTICFFLSWVLYVSGYAQPAPPVRTTQSVLSTGTWYKIGITNAGLYRLDRAFLQTLGLPVDQLDPRQLQLFGNGGAMLPQLNSEPRPDDLVQNAIFVAGESDGQFNANDYALFYAPGPHRWHFDPVTNRFRHEQHLYSDTSYYFLRVGTTPGLRVKTQTSPGNPTGTITTFQERLYHEQDLVNVLQSGRNWYGEAFNSLTLNRTFSFPLPDLAPGSSIQVTSAVMSSAERSSRFEVKVNQQVIANHFFGGVGRHDYHAAGEAHVQTAVLPTPTLANNSLPVTLSFYPDGAADAMGYLDYLEINAERLLRLTGKELSFRSTRYLGTNQVVSFQVANIGPEAAVWEITDPLRPRVMALQRNNTQATFNARQDTLREYLAFTGSDFPKPQAFGRVANQNLHGLNLNGQLDLVIVTHPWFLAQAEKLAQHRRQHDQLEVAVVTTHQVYHEFASGSQDVTAIRDLMKMIHERRTGSKPLYLLLFGDASYDYKTPPFAQKGRTPANTNFVPVYESRESLDPLGTYSSEDYYGFLDESEGNWSETSFGTQELLDIGIGRLPVKTTAEAEAVVKKLLHYDSPASFGAWRNRVTLVADDGDESEHLRDAESLAALLQQQQPRFQPRKIYLDLYQQQQLPNGQRSPKTNVDLDQAVAQGSLILNFTGHGNETSLTHEQILTLPQIENWKNLDKLMFMVTATCEFGRYDDPRRSSGAELALLNPAGGAMGLLTTTRPVYASTNRLLNRNFFLETFTPDPGPPPRLGELVRLTKNNSQAQISNRNFTLLGDPSQRLAFPALKAEVTQVNQVAVTGNLADTVRALQQVRLAGKITQAAGNLAASFNGTIEVRVLDKPTAFKTLGDDSRRPENNIHDIRINENVIYAGRATVKNGLWELQFIVPKDISYHYGTGQISLYAYNQQTDAHGLSPAIVVGGSAPDAAPDTTPPRIRLFLDDESFVDGGLTGKSPVLLAHLSDESGINTAATSIGHEITAQLDQDPAQSFVLNNYYTARQDDFRAGTVSFPLPNLTPGKHRLTFKAWDTHNNSTEASINFTVTETKQLVLAGVKNFPNPFAEMTTFQFDHNRNDGDLDIQILIFTVTGKVVKVINTTWTARGAHLPQITWDGRDDAGAIVGNGIYLYQVVVRSSEDGAQAEKTNKLIKLK